MPADQHRGASPLTVITPIIPGREEAVQTALKHTQQKLDAGGHNGFTGIGTVHFARWVMLHHGDQAQLLFATNFDGPWDAYIEAFIPEAWEVFDAIWSNCEGYPEYGAQDSVAFKEFVRKHQLKEDVSYRAYDASVAEIRRAMKISHGAKQMLEGFQELA